MERTLPDTRPMPVIAAAIVGLTLTTAYIHFSLGGVLFTLNAAGYAAFAVALILITAVPHPLIRRFDWAPRIGLAGYAALTIGAYLVIGPYFTLGWVAKAIEIAIIALVLVDLRHAFGTPAGFVRAALSSLGLRSDSRSVTVA
jgi:hypothetical protein